MEHTRAERSTQGFSLVELMVALTITLIIAGSIYALLGSGQSRFRQEPELSDRQQNIRMAMDLIQRDLMNAGSGFGAFTQIFTEGLDGAGPEGPSGTAANGYFEHGHLDAGGAETQTDVLEFLARDSGCPSLPIFQQNGVNLDVLTTIPSCYTEPGLLLITFPGGVTKWGWMHEIHSANMYFNFPPGQQPVISQIDGPPDLNGALSVMSAALIRYEIDDCPGEPVPVPCLWRSVNGGRDIDFLYGSPAANPDRWRMVARAIEDMQVVYTMADGTVSNTPVAVAANNFATLVREVRVTLTARATGNLMQGAFDPVNPGGTNQFPRAVRGRMTTVASIRSALGALSTIPDGSPNVALLHR